jgi:hypothetical protein
MDESRRPRPPGGRRRPTGSGSSATPPSRGQGSTNTTVDMSRNEPSPNRDDHAATQTCRKTCATSSRTDTPPVLAGTGRAQFRDRATPTRSATNVAGYPPAHPAGRRSFMTVPLSLMTIDGLPHTRLTTIDDAPRRSATRPADRTRQADHRTVARIPVRPTSSTLSTTIASPRSRPFRTQQDSPGPGDPNRPQPGRRCRPKRQKDLGTHDFWSHSVRRRFVIDVHPACTDAGLAALARAGRTFDRADSTSNPQWIGYVDEAYLSAKFGHCFAALGQGKLAARFAVRSLEMDGSAYARG